jgi:plasmid stability protein
MASLTIRNIPDLILDQIRVLSEVERRSLNNELLMIIENGLNTYTKTNKVMFDKELQLSIWNDVCGKWDDGRSSDEIINDIYSSRTKGRSVEL